MLTDYPNYSTSLPKVSAKIELKIDEHRKFLLLSRADRRNFNKEVGGTLKQLISFSLILNEKLPRTRGQPRGTIPESINYGR